MKKALILGLVMVFALGMVLVGCGDKAETTTTAAPATTAPPTTAAPTETTAAAGGDEVGIFFEDLGNNVVKITDVPAPGMSFPVTTSGDMASTIEAFDASGASLGKLTTDTGELDYSSVAGKAAKIVVTGPTGTVSEWTVPAGGAPAGPAQEPVIFKFASTFMENETGGQIDQHFIELIEEQTAGAVTFDYYPGGTLGGAGEMLGLVSSGSVDFISFGHPAASADLPLLFFPMWCPGDQQTAIDYFNYLVFENPETSALIQAEAEAHNIKYLGFVAGGSNVFGAKQPWTTLADLNGKKIATMGMTPAFEALGMQVVQSPPPDTYENLSRGVADCFQMGFAPTVQMKWYEAAPYYMYDGTFAAGNPWTVNLDSWAKLTPETQQIFMDVAKEMETWSSDLTATAEAESVAALQAAGGTIGTLSAEDQATWWDSLFRVFIEEMVWPGAVAGDYTDDMSKILSAAAEFTKTEWTPPAP